MRHNRRQFPLVLFVLLAGIFLAPSKPARAGGYGEIHWFLQLSELLIPDLGYEFGSSRGLNLTIPIHFSFIDYDPSSHAEYSSDRPSDAPGTDFSYLHHSTSSSSSFRAIISAFVEAQVYTAGRTGGAAVLGSRTWLLFGGIYPKGILLEAGGSLGSHGGGGMVGAGIVLAQEGERNSFGSINLLYRSTWTQKGQWNYLSLDFCFPIWVR